MNVYVYQAALLCELCGEDARAVLECPGVVDDETTYDSDQYPKGPYPDGGGEADSPQHCDACDLFLENALTAEGEAYLLEVVAETRVGPCVEEWCSFYGIERPETETTHADP